MLDDNTNIQGAILHKPWRIGLFLIKAVRRHQIDLAKRNPKSSMQNDG